MSYNELPDHIVIQILTQLNDRSKLGAMSVFERWAEIFASTSQLIDKFKLEIDNFVREWELNDLPNIPIKNVSFYGPYREDPSECLIPILKKYEESIKNIAFEGGEFLTVDFAKVLKLKNLEHLKLANVDIRAIGFYEQCHHLTTPTIKSLDIVGKCPNIHRTFDLFNNCSSIEKLSLRYDVEYDHTYFDRDVLYDLIKSLPKLKHFNFWSNKSHTYETVLEYDFPVKLEKLEIRCLDYYGREEEQIDFFWSQKDTMKELIFHGDAKCYLSDILEFILTEMNLKYFQCGGIKMIIDYERQPASFFKNQDMNE